MSVLLPAILAGAAAAVLVALPDPGRLQRLLASGAAAPGGVRSWRPTSWPTSWQVTSPRVLLLAALAVTALAGPALALLSVAAAVAAGRWAVAAAGRRAAAAERAGAVEACGVLASELTAGRAPAAALAAAAEVATGPARDALLAAAAGASLGGDVGPALLAGASRSAVPGLLRALATCWTVCAASGSGLAAAVQRLEEGLRGEQAQRRAVDAELAGPRATAGLLAVLPVAGLLMAAGLGADPLHFLLATPLGLVCLVLGLGLDTLGVLWTSRLVRRAGGAS